jgi:hypothetical protein
MPPPRTTHLKPDRCPACLYRLDAAIAAFKDVTPSPGDFTVCIQCGAVLEFDNNLHVQKVSEQGKQKIAGTPQLAIQLARVVEGVQRIKRRN